MFPRDERRGAVNPHNAVRTVAMLAGRNIIKFDANDDCLRVFPRRRA
jgi:hypothetical protein